MRRGDDRARLRAEVAAAAHLVAPLWPIEHFIAVNPLLGVLEHGFEEATAAARRWFGAHTLPDGDAVRAALAQGALDHDDLRIAAVEVLGAVDGADDAADRVVGNLVGGIEPARPPIAPRTVLERLDAATGADRAPVVDAEVARWCALLVDRGHLPFTLPEGAWPAWRAMAVGDAGVRRLGGRRARRWVGELPERADDAVLELLGRLGVGPDDRGEELRGQLARLPGWAGYARWCDEWAGPDDPAPRLPLLDLMAVHLALDALSLHGAGIGPGAVPPPVAAAGPPPSVEGRLALHALEGGYRRRLLASLNRSPAAAPAPQDVAVQAVFCIDARSEGLRRHLEALGPYDTLGFAGFFAVPMRHRPAGSTEAYPSAPVLLTPTVEAPEVAAPGDEDAVAGALAGAATATSAHRAVDAAAHGPLSMYALAEGAGWVLGPLALARTLHPQPPAPDPRRGTRVAVEGDGPGPGFPLAQRTLIAESALRTMGLTEGFAPLVLLCGHGSTTTANAHAAALDCGACGGNRGGPNARAAAAIFNDPDVRQELRERGIDIPDSTRFVAGEHDTATDQVVVYDDETLGPDHQSVLTTLRGSLAEAGRRLAAERLARLPGRVDGAPERRVRARAGDWAETRPEWGLARNAAFIVGSRDLTRGLDLGTRTFLHSYDPVADDDGTALETILTAPMVVAHWINAQYYFSTVDPDRFGAGDKVLHNVVAGIGVVLGQGGDLRPGLPWQSVWAADGSGHVPVRLLTVVDAPRDRLDDVIARNPVLRHLFDGAWVHLVARDGLEWRRRLPGGAWVSAEGCAPEVVAA